MSETPDRDETPAYGLVMPFVVCQPDGPWDAEAFVAGYEMGSIDADPSLVGSTGRHIHTPNIPQADLIAMRHGFTCEVGDVDNSGEWTFIRFHRLPHLAPATRPLEMSTRDWWIQYLRGLWSGGPA